MNLDKAYRIVDVIDYDIAKELKRDDPDLLLDMANRMETIMREPEGLPVAPLEFHYCGQGECQVRIYDPTAKYCDRHEAHIAMGFEQPSG